MTRYKCSRCGKTADMLGAPMTCECGGLWDLDFEAPRYDEKLIDKSRWNIFRYLAFMPPLGARWQGITLGEGMTSTVEYEKNLFFKLDYAMPTLSFKDRGAAALIWLCSELGVKRIIQDSSGNAGNSVAAYAARANIECEIFVPRGTSQKKINMISACGATVTVFNGTRDETADACREKARALGIFYANHVYNPMFYQGTKTFIYEIFEQLGRMPDNLFIPTGNGTLLLGARYGLHELFVSGAIPKLPKIFLVQSERCAPLFGAELLPRAITPHQTLAEGVAIGKPMRGAQLLSGYLGEQEVICAPEHFIELARRDLARGGFFVEHTTAATYAAYLCYKAINDLEGDTLLPLCGAGLKSEK